MTFFLGATRSKFFSNRMVLAVGWSTLAQLAGQFIRIATSLVLTRLLAPEMFGVISLVAAIHMVLTLLSDVGVRVTIIQSARGDHPDFLNTAWTLAIVRGFGHWGICILLAIVLSLAQQLGFLGSGTAWGNPQLPAILVVTGLSAVLSGFQSTNYHSASRRLDLGRQSTIEISSQVIGAIFAIALSWWMRSVWALVISGLISSLIVTVLSHTWMVGIRNRLAWERSAISELIQKGSWILLSSSTFAITQNIDRFALAAIANAATLGIYSLASNIVLLTDGICGRLVSAVALPRLSEASRKSNQEVRSALKMARLGLDVPMMLAAGSLFAAGPAVIELMYDRRYYDAGYMVQILSFILVFSRFGLFATTYVALGRPRDQAIVNVVKLISLAVLMPVLYRLSGFDGALIAIACHGALTLPFIFAFNAKLELNNWPFELLLWLVWPVGYAIGTLISILIGK